MATATAARLVTVRYDGGSVRATRAAIRKLTGETDAALESQGWGRAPGARRPYGYRRRTNAAAGTPLKVDFADGETWTYRVTGPIKRFLDRVVRRGLGDEVDMVTSPRGAEFSREFFADLDD